MDSIIWYRTARVGKSSIITPYLPFGLLFNSLFSFPLISIENISGFITNDSAYSLIHSSDIGDEIKKALIIIEESIHAFQESCQYIGTVPAILFHPLPSEVNFKDQEGVINSEYLKFIQSEITY